MGRVRMDRASLGHKVRPLEVRGLVRLEVGKDCRSREVSITETGRNAIAQGRELWRPAQQTFEDEIGEAAAATLRETLRRVAATAFMLPGAKARSAFRPA